MEPWFPSRHLIPDRLREEYPPETLLWAYRKPLVLASLYWQDIVPEEYVRAIPTERLGQVKYDQRGMATELETQVYLHSLEKYLIEDPSERASFENIVLRLALYNDKVLSDMRRQLWNFAERAFYERVDAEQLELRFNE